MHCIFSNLHDCIGAAGSKFDLDSQGVWCVCVTRYAMQTSGVVGRSDNGWCRGSCYHKSISNHHQFFLRHWILPHILNVATATRWYNSSIVHVFAAIQFPFEEQGSLFFVDSGASSTPSDIHIHISSRNHRKNDFVVFRCHAAACTLWGGVSARHTVVWEIQKEAQICAPSQYVPAKGTAWVHLLMGG